MQKSVFSPFQTASRFRVGRLSKFLRIDRIVNREIHLKEMFIATAIGDLW